MVIKESSAECNTCGCIYESEQRYLLLKTVCVCVCVNLKDEPFLQALLDSIISFAFSSVMHEL